MVILSFDSWVIKSMDRRSARTTFYKGLNLINSNQKTSQVLRNFTQKLLDKKVLYISFVFFFLNEVYLVYSNFNKLFTLSVKSNDEVNDIQAGEKRKRADFMEMKM